MKAKMKNMNRSRTVRSRYATIDVAGKMKSTMILLVMMLTLGSVFTSCKKYEDGPGLSLRSKRARVANTWVVSKATDKNGVDITSEYAGSTWEFKKDGTSLITFDFFGSPIACPGMWTFQEKKERIVFNLNVFGDIETDTMSILMLKQKEMHTEAYRTGEKIEFKEK